MMAEDEMDGRFFWNERWVVTYVEKDERVESSGPLHITYKI